MAGEESGVGVAVALLLRVLGALEADLDESRDLFVVHALCDDIVKTDLEGGGSEFSFEDRRKQERGEIAPSGG